MQGDVANESAVTRLFEQSNRELGQLGMADRLQKVLPQVPMGRLGTPQECAEAILWLMSGEAAYMTGAVLPLSGGR